MFPVEFKGTTHKISPKLFIITSNYPWMELLEGCGVKLNAAFITALRRRITSIHLGSEFPDDENDEFNLRASKADYKRAKKQLVAAYRANCPEEME